jgi:3D (Asp-Asp-Asp) domain-containing protein
MGIETTSALPRTQRRNRLMLGAAILAISPAVGIVAGDLLVSDRPAVPLLIAVDELSVSDDRPLAKSERRHSLLTEFGTPAVNTSLTSVPDGLPAIDGPPSPPNGGDVRWFNGRPVRAVRTISMIVTAYSPDELSCGDSADGITASGYSVWTNGMKMAAADTDVLPFGTLVSVPGYDDGRVVPVLDRGGAIKGNRLDMLYPTHQQARSFGSRVIEVTVWDYADGRPSDYPPIYHWGSSVIATDG